MPFAFFCKLILVKKNKLFTFHIFFVKNIIILDFFFLFLANNCKPRFLFLENMRKTGFIYKVFDLYYDGFKHMTLGRTLWAVILVKLFIMFVILKLFFFPNFIKQNAPEGQEAEFVGQQLVDRSGE